ALGPDGALYVVNNGGFIWSDLGGMLIPLDLATGANEPPDFQGGWVDRVDLDTGEVTTLYRECDGRRLCSPNDIVFDAEGGFWFTDLGKMRAHDLDRGGLFYATADGSTISQPVHGLLGANGVGLAPDGGTVYVAESHTGRLLAWTVEGPGQVAGRGGVRHGGRCVVATPAGFDSLAVEADGHVVVAAIGHGLCVVDPGTGEHEFVEMPDPLVTNICFTGDDDRTAYTTMSGGGWLGEMTWPRPGLALAY
ncbi:MAG: SMP-30/gluconolactonase/LRE family protein, partial [Acidimicrobiales bacterium]